MVIFMRLKKERKMFEGKIFLILIILFCLMLANDIYAAESLEQAPAFEFITLKGDTIKYENLQGKIIVLDFWNTLCIPCVKAMPGLEKLYKKYKIDSSVVIFVINSGWEPIEKAKAFADKKRGGFLFLNKKKYDLPFAYDIDSRLFKSLGFNGNPSTLIIDRHYNVRVKHCGEVKDIFSYIDGNIQDLLAEE
jgi:thiol-disulfide isomerase/thioredoxin